MLTLQLLVVLCGCLLSFPGSDCFVNLRVARTSDDICSSPTVIFATERLMAESYDHRISLAGTAPLYTGHNIDPIKKHGMLDDDSLEGEVTFLRMQHEFLHAYYNKVFESGYLTIQYECQFLPTRCTVVHLINSMEFARYDDENVILNEKWKTYSSAEEGILLMNIAGTGMNFLERLLDGSRQRWVRICERLVAEDRPRNNVFSLFRYRGQENTVCSMRSPVPLNYSMQVHGVPDYDFYVNRKRGTVSAVFKATSFENVICQITSPAGWMVNLSYADSPEANSGLLQSSFSDKYMESEEASWHEKHEHVQNDEHSVPTDDVTMVLASAILMLSFVLLLIAFRLRLRLFAFDRFLALLRLRIRLLLSGLTLKP